MLCPDMCYLHLLLIIFLIYYYVVATISWWIKITISCIVVISRTCSSIWLNITTLHAYKILNPRLIAIITMIKFVFRHILVCTQWLQMVSVYAVFNIGFRSPGYFEMEGLGNVWRKCLTWFCQTSKNSKCQCAAE